MNVGLAWVECDSSLTIQSLVIQKQESTIKMMEEIHQNDSIIMIADKKRINIMTHEIAQKDRIIKSEKIRRWVSVGSSVFVTAIVTARLTRN